ncbi:unnamed protein product [Paramecium sonneborni]|uniref:Transmembrane protein n=1 Tax=Paramecium sonneborni TaxID=65129 RepID=A0A8S1Q8N0_9CILI|nr:unnamed protein product [Paramecium sonneborni]
MIKNKEHWIYGTAVMLASLGVFKYAKKSQQFKSKYKIEFSLLHLQYLIIIRNQLVLLIMEILVSQIQYYKYYKFHNQCPQVINPISLNICLNQQHIQMDKLLQHNKSVQNQLKL